MPAISQAERFPILVVASLIVFVIVLRFATRNRATRTSWWAIGTIAAIVVAGGMYFARFTQQAGLPWWMYYGVPAAVTLCLPPIAFKLNRREAVQYLVLAYLSAPAINVAFSFGLGWHDYMPFMHVPYWRDLLAKA